MQTELEEAVDLWGRAPVSCDQAEAAALATVAAIIRLARVLEDHNAMVREALQCGINIRKIN
jgi:hypothetical protein